MVTLDDPPRISSKHCNYILPHQKGNPLFPLACISIMSVESVSWNVELWALRFSQPCFCYNYNISDPKQIHALRSSTMRIVEPPASAPREDCNDWQGEGQREWREDSRTFCLFILRFLLLLSPGALDVTTSLKPLSSRLSAPHMILRSSSSITSCSQSGLQLHTVPTGVVTRDTGNFPVLPHPALSCPSQLNQD